MTNTSPPSADIPALVRELTEMIQRIESEGEKGGNWHVVPIYLVKPLLSHLLAQEQQIKAWRGSLEFIAERWDDRKIPNLQVNDMAIEAKLALAKFPKQP